MGHSFNLLEKSPRECSERELAAFLALVQEGGEVDSDGLANRISSAARLFLLVDATGLIGTAALKQPVPRYRLAIGQRAGTAVNADSYPFELGWIYVSPAARRKGYAAMLVSSALVYAARRGVFATTRCDNEAMRLLLTRSGFKQAGVQYSSKDGNRELCLLLTPPAIGGA